MKILWDFFISILKKRKAPVITNAIAIEFFSIRKKILKEVFRIYLYNVAI